MRSRWPLLRSQIDGRSLIRALTDDAPFLRWIAIHLLTDSSTIGLVGVWRPARSGAPPRAREFGIDHRPLEDDPDRIDPEDDDADDAPEPSVTVEITGLSLYTHHGVEQSERDVGQRLVFDLSFDVGECDATVTDRVEDTV